MTLEELCLEIEARYGPVAEEYQIRGIGIVMLARGDGIMTNLALTAKDVAEALIDRFTAKEVPSGEAMMEMPNDNFVTDRISTAEKKPPVDKLTPVSDLSRDIANVADTPVTPLNAKFVVEGVHGFMCILSAIEYHTTASSVAAKIGICRSTQVEGRG